MSISDQIIGVESGGNQYAANPNSSAYGPGQFLNSTWLSMMNKYRPDLVAGKSDSEILGMRSDPQLSKDMTDAYANENGQYLAQKGFSVTPGSTYLAHFAGPGGAVKVLGADPTASVSDVLGPAVVAANPFLKNMTAADLRAWADKKMGSVPAMGGAPVQPVQQAQAAPPMNISPSLPFGSGTPAPQQPIQPQPLQGAGGMSPNASMQAGISPQQAQQIQFAQRKPIDMARFQQTLAQLRSIYRG